MEGFWFQTASNEDVSDHNYYKESTSPENETRSQDIRNSDIPNKNNNLKKRNKSKSSNCSLSNPPLTVLFRNNAGISQIQHRGREITSATA